MSSFHLQWVYYLSKAFPADFCLLYDRITCRPIVVGEIEALRSKLRGMFCLAAVLRADCKEFYDFSIRSLTLQQAEGNALAVAVQVNVCRM
jgi:hypothetical protein